MQISPAGGIYTAFEYRFRKTHDPDHAGQPWKNTDPESPDLPALTQKSDDTSKAPKNFQEPEKYRFHIFAVRPF